MSQPNLSQYAEQIRLLRGEILFDEDVVTVDDNPEAAQFLLLALANLEQAAFHLKLADMRMRSK